MSKIVAEIVGSDAELDLDYQVQEALTQAIDAAGDEDGEAARPIWVQCGHQLFQVSKIVVSRDEDDPDAVCDITIHIEPI